MSALTEHCRSCRIFRNDFVSAVNKICGECARELIYVGKLNKTFLLVLHL